MNHGPAAFNRLIVFIVGAAMIVVGAAAIGWKSNASWIHDRMQRLDLNWFRTAPDSSWWVWALVGVAVIGVVLGIWLLAVNVRPQRARTLSLPGSNAGGKLTLAPNKVADAIADEIAAAPEITSAKARALDDRKRELVQVTVVAAPEVSYDDIIARLREAAENLRVALPDESLRPRFLVHLDGARDSASRVR
ncbi:hypothetical protein GCM10027169_30740 [Gordonia jinhuaensis]|uniref:Alkaline shock response membrane anchor protein AmaP n=1 Tax=Gordonia jinhuaensis TaxID=1517702 RepID=A0A916WW50_9ACTN|nr:hypothetical protein [Gordonia jinhuaensis]GGB35239.1 hypothetical protein GCM10011489_24090 [Gordonia jinhuaensis]